MRRVTMFSLLSLFVLSLVSSVGAVQQKTVQARVRGAAERPAAPTFSLADASGTIGRLFRRRI